MLLHGPGRILAQTLVTECIHRDSVERVVYLEREYRDADTSVYHSAYVNGARLLKYHIEHHGDTMDEYFRYHERHPLPPPMGLDGYEWSVSAGVDSSWLEMLDFDGSTIWDTVVVSKGSEDADVLDRVMRPARDFAQMVYDGDMDLGPFHTHPRESWHYRSCRGMPTELLVHGRDGQLTNRQTFQVVGSWVLALSYFGSDTVPYATDSIWVAPDSSFMKVVKRRLDWGTSGGPYVWSYQFTGDTSVFVEGEERVVQHWVYYRTPWNVRIRKAAMGEGPLQLSRIAESRDVLLSHSLSSNGSEGSSDHRWGPEGQLLESIVYTNGRFDRSIEYRYY